MNLFINGLNQKKERVSKEFNEWFKSVEKELGDKINTRGFNAFG